MHSKTKILFAGIVTIAITSSAQAAHAKHRNGTDWPPKFEQYPATATFKGVLTYDRYGCGRKFRDQIRYAIRNGGINFAGDSVLVEWGCGTYCQSHALVYGPTGKVNCDLPTSQVGAKFKKSSKLIILNPPELLKTVPGNEAKYFNPTQYFLWNDGKLSELLPPKGKGGHGKHHKQTSH